MILGKGMERRPFVWPEIYRKSCFRPMRGVLFQRFHSLLCCYCYCVCQGRKFLSSYWQLLTTMTLARRWYWQQMRWVWSSWSSQWEWDRTWYRPTSAPWPEWPSLPASTTSLLPPEMGSVPNNYELNFCDVWLFRCRWLKYGLWRLVRRNLSSQLADVVWVQWQWIRLGKGKVFITHRQKDIIVYDGAGLWLVVQMGSWRCGAITAESASRHSTKVRRDTI